jgi:hypothetical protein
MIIQPQFNKKIIMAKKHFIVTFENNKAQTANTLDWAKENNFPGYNEQTKNEEVYIYLVDKKGFRLVSDDEKFVCYNFNHQIILFFRYSMSIFEIS